MNREDPAGAKSEVFFVFEAVDAVPVKDSAVNQATDGRTADSFRADVDVPGEVSVELDDFVTRQKRIQASDTDSEREQQDHYQTSRHDELSTPPTVEPDDKSSNSEKADPSEEGSEPGTTSLPTLFLVESLGSADALNRFRQRFIFS